MNIRVNSDTSEDFLNGSIEFIAEIYENAPNPTITLRKDENGEIGLHLVNWNCNESIEVYTGEDINELLECIHQAKLFLASTLTDINNGQQTLFNWENYSVREN